MTKGTLLDRQNKILLEHCTLDQALDWLRLFHGRGWRDGNTLWIPDDNCWVIRDAMTNFQHFAQHYLPLPTSCGYSTHFTE